MEEPPEIKIEDMERLKSEVESLLLEILDDPEPRIFKHTAYRIEVGVGIGQRECIHAEYSPRKIHLLRPKIELLEKRLKEHFESLKEPIGISFSRAQFRLESALYWLADTAFQLSDGMLPPCRKAVERALDDFWNGLNTRCVGLVALVPVRSVSLTDEIVFSNKVRLKKLSEEELNRVYGGPLEYRKEVGQLPNSTALEIRFSEQVQNGTEIFRQSLPTGVLESIDLALSTLALLGSGLLTADHIHCYTDSAYLPFPIPESHFRQRLYGRRSFLTQRVDQREIKDIYQNLRTLDQKRIDELDQTDRTGAITALRRAIDKLLDSSRRMCPLEQILNGVMGLEGLLLYRASYGGYAYRFALNYALLGQNDEDRHARMDKARYIYQLRNKIVHGDEIKNAKMKTGTERTKLDKNAAADLVLETLREVAKRALMDESFRFYKGDAYWSELILGPKTAG